MATFTITATTTVAELKQQFNEQFGGTLRIYDGRSKAPYESVQLVELGAKEGSLEFQPYNTVEEFETAFLNELNLKVEVFTPDNWVAVLNGIILGKIRQIPNSSTRASMEVFLPTFTITPTTTVTELKEQFNKEIGGILRVYQGRSEASTGATLVSLGAQPGAIDWHAEQTVGQLKAEFQEKLNLKVNVFTADNWVAVLDDIALGKVRQIPNSSTKTSMAAFL